MTIVMGLDQHRAQITADWLDTESGEVLRARVMPADRAGVARFLARLSQAGFDGDLEAEDVCPGERRRSVDGPTEEVPAGAARARRRGWCSRPAGRSRTSRAISGCRRRRCASTCARPRPTRACGRICRRSGGARGDQAAAQGGLRAAPRERDPEGRVACFSRPSSTQTDRSEPRSSTSIAAASASSRSAGPWACRRPPTTSAPPAQRSARAVEDERLLERIRELHARQLLRLRLPAHVEGAAARRRARSAATASSG